MHSTDTLTADLARLDTDRVTEPHVCGSCGAIALSKFCAECGEPVSAHRDLSISHFLKHALHDLTHFDTRFVRTMQLLVVKPGELTVRAVEGRSRAVMKPFQLFLVLNLVFFLLNASFFRWHLETYTYSADGRPNEKLQLVEGRINTLQLSSAQYQERFDAKLHTNEKGFIVLLIPVVALVLQILYLRRRRYFVEHLLASTHFLSFMLLFLLLSQAVIGVPLLGIAYVADLLGYTFAVNEEVTVLFVFVALFAYLWPALRRTYSDGRGTSLVRAVITSAAVIPLILIYREFLFWVTYWSI